MYYEGFQGVSRKIYPFPKTISPQEHARIRILTKLMDKLMFPSAHPLREELNTRAFELRSERKRGFFDARKGSKEHERSPSDNLDKLDEELLIGSLLFVFSDITELSGNIEQCLFCVIKIGL